MAKTSVNTKVLNPKAYRTWSVSTMLTCISLFMYGRSTLDQESLRLQYF